ARSTLPEHVLAGPVSLSPAGFEAGGHEVGLEDAGGKMLARIPVWVKAPGMKPALTLDRTVYRPGEPITVRWRNVPGNRRDWLAIYAAAGAERPAPARNGQRLWR